jgi:sterol O-acyltransferase
MARLSSANTLPIVTNSSSSLDRVPQLVGQLNSDGLANLIAGNDNAASKRPNPPRAMKAALDAVADSRSGSSLSSGSESASEEDYDALKHDPMAVITGGKGGGFVAEPSGKNTPELSIDKTYQDIKPALEARPGPTRLKSIPVTLNKLKEKGKYVLTADDEDLREILRIGLERVGACVAYFSVWVKLTLSTGEKSIWSEEETKQIQ